MGESVIARGGTLNPDAPVMKWIPITEVITENKTWTCPANIKNSQIEVRLFGGGGGAGGSGGGGGHMNNAVLTVGAGASYQITIGKGVAYLNPPESGGITSFSTLVAANGGKTSDLTNPGDGGTGGGGAAGGGQIGIGGTGSYGGGGGASYSSHSSSAYRDGGCGGMWGGGGGAAGGTNGGGGSSPKGGKGGNGGVYGGKGGNGGWVWGSLTDNTEPGQNSINTTGMPIEFVGFGIGGSKGWSTINGTRMYWGGGGGGGGYGGNGGSGGYGSDIEFGDSKGGAGGGGGGYGANGGNAVAYRDTGAHRFIAYGGGGGGYGGNGANATYGGSESGGGGGGYGPSNYGAGGGGTAINGGSGKSGCCIIKYYQLGFG